MTSSGTSASSLADVAAAAAAAAMGRHELMAEQARSSELWQFCSCERTHGAAVGTLTRSVAAIRLHRKAKSAETTRLPRTLQIPPQMCGRGARVDIVEVHCERRGRRVGGSGRRVEREWRAAPTHSSIACSCRGASARHRSRSSRRMLVYSASTSAASRRGASSSTAAEKSGPPLPLLLLVTEMTRSSPRDDISSYGSPCFSHGIALQTRASTTAIARRAVVRWKRPCPCARG